jgi:hypothetical protein
MHGFMMFLRQVFRVEELGNMHLSCPLILLVYTECMWMHITLRSGLQPDIGTECNSMFLSCSTSSKPQARKNCNGACKANESICHHFSLSNTKLQDTARGRAARNLAAP